MQKIKFEIEINLKKFKDITQKFKFQREKKHRKECSDKKILHRLKCQNMKMLHLFINGLN